MTGRMVRHRPVFTMTLVAAILYLACARYGVTTRQFCDWIRDGVALDPELSAREQLTLHARLSAPSRRG